MQIDRNKIIAIAKAEAEPAPYGKVSDNVLDVDKNRKEWRILKDYFEKACGWTEKEWNAWGYLYVGTAKTRADQNAAFNLPGKPGWKNIQYIEGIKKPKYRIPQGESKPTGLSWCGIFATWVWRTAGLNVRWVNSQGVVGAKVKRVIGNKGFSVGDIVILNTEEVHHCIVSEMPKVGNGFIETINGNSQHDQRIEVHNRWQANNVAFYYTIRD